MSAVKDTDRELAAIAEEVMKCRGTVLKAFGQAHNALKRLQVTHGTSKSPTATRALSWLIEVHDSLLIGEDDLHGVMEQVEALRGEL